MTSEKHTEYITKGHQVSRHSSRPDVFYFVSSSHFLKTILASRTSGTFGFAPTHKANPSATAKQSRTPLKINYAVSKTKRATF